MLVKPSTTTGKSPARELVDKLMAQQGISEAQAIHLIAISRADASEHGRGFFQELTELGVNASENLVPGIAPLGQAESTARAVSGTKTPSPAQRAGNVTHEGEQGAEHAAAAAAHQLSGLAGELGKLVQTYGLRLLEILAGGALVLFALVTLAKGGEPPKAPKVVPVPV